MACITRPGAHVAPAHGCAHARDPRARWIPGRRVRRGRIDRGRSRGGACVLERPGACAGAGRRDRRVRRARIARGGACTRARGRTIDASGAGGSPGRTSGVDRALAIVSCGLAERAGIPARCIAGPGGTRRPGIRAAVARGGARGSAYGRSRPGAARADPRGILLRVAEASRKKVLRIFQETFPKLGCRSHTDVGTQNGPTNSLAAPGVRSLRWTLRGARSLALPTNSISRSTARLAVLGSPEGCPLVPPRKAARKDGLPTAANSIEVRSAWSADPRAHGSTRSVAALHRTKRREASGGTLSR